MAMLITLFLLVIFASFNLSLLIFRALFRDIPLCLFPEILPSRS
jgi:hypothetical protein